MTSKIENPDSYAALVSENETLRRELQDMRQSYERFSLLATHDVQGALRKVIQSAEILNMDARNKLSKEDLFFLNAIISASMGLYKLFPELMSFCDMSLYVLNKEIIPLEEVVQACIADLLSAIPKANIRARANITVGDLPNVFADVKDMKLLFQALIGNSLKFVNPDGPISIEICAREEERAIKIDVIDNGLGIEAPDHVDVFEPFIRLNSKQDYPGAGLGLAVSQLICTRHGWSLDYVSQPAQTHMTITVNIEDIR